MINDLVDMYVSAAQSAPLLTNMATAFATFTIGDALSQYIVDKKVNVKKLGYSATLAPLYGAMLYGLVESGEMIGPLVNDNSMAKAALGPNLIGNGANAVLFYNNTIGQKTNYSIKGLADDYVDFVRAKDKWARLKENIPAKEFTKSVVSTLTFWNAFHFVNYEYVSEAMRTPLTLATSLVWLTVLSLWSLKGSRNLIDKQ